MVPELGLSPRVGSKTKNLKESSVNNAFSLFKAIYSYVNSFGRLRLVRGLRLLVLGVGLWMMGVSVWGQCNTALTSAVGTDNQSVCVNSAITSITYSTDATLIASSSGIPSGVSASLSGNILTISGTPTTSTGSPYNYSISSSDALTFPNFV